MGAALGGSAESVENHQEIETKVHGTRAVTCTGKEVSRTSWIVTISSIAVALGCMLCLNYCRQATVPLGVAESIDREFQIERSPIG
jgi:hypothetical protein